ncbi:MAG: cobalamin-binding protein [Deltaproteobacteria bacterium]|nr:cobalamin-binding protein [Candidatus Zymogenaceae bacterium]
MYRHLICAVIIFALVVSAGVSCRAGEARSLIDQMGREVTVPENPGRIVSLAPNITEILFALDAGDRVVGVTVFSDYPEAAASIPVVGTYITPNLEVIVALKPDLVIATADGDKQEPLAILETFGIPVYVINPKGVDDVIDTVIEIGELVGEGEEARKIADEMQGVIRDVEERVKDLEPVSVLMALDIEPVITVGTEAFAHELIERAGGVNAAGSRKIRYPRISLEAVIAAAPEVIIIPSMSFEADTERALAFFAAYPTIPAVMTGRIHVIEADIVTRPGPRIVEGLFNLAALLHPDAFKDMPDDESET